MTSNLNQLADQIRIFIKNHKLKHLKVKVVKDTIIIDDCTAFEAAHIAELATGQKFQHITKSTCKPIPFMLQTDEGEVFTLESFLYTNTQAKDVDHISEEDAEIVKNLKVGEQTCIHITWIKRIS